MKKFWDIEFDNENPFFDEDFVEGLLKLGFQKKSKNIYIKEVVNHHGNVIKDGIIFDLSQGQIVYYPEPDCTVKMNVEDADIMVVDQFLRNNII